MVEVKLHHYYSLKTLSLSQTFSAELKKGGEKLPKNLKNDDILPFIV
jgi:hypothetical protein